MRCWCLGRFTPVESWPFDGGVRRDGWEVGDSSVC